MADKNHEKISEILVHKGFAAVDVARSINSDPNLSMLDSLARSVDAKLKSRAEYRENFRKSGHEPPPCDDGVEERALTIRHLASSAREHIRLNEAADAANCAARAAYLLCELDTLMLGKKGLVNLKESIRLAAKPDLGTT